MLEGINVNLRAMEPEDLSILHEWLNNLEFKDDILHLYRGQKKK